LRRVELLLILAFIGATLIAGFIGSQLGPDPRQFDLRLSTNVSGPSGARALALTIEALGVTTQQRRSPLFDLGEDGPVGAGVTIALLDLSTLPSESELLALRRHVDAGGHLFTAGYNLIENCFGLAIGRSLQRVGPDSMPLDLPPEVGPVPAATRWLVILGDSASGVEPEQPLQSAGGASEPDTGLARSDTTRGAERRWTYATGEVPDGCRMAPASVDTILAATDSIPIALSLEFAGGGRVTALADADYLSNTVLRESDAGALVIPWLLAGDPTRIVFDEYHHGFGRNRSLWLAAGGWLVSSPAGWAILQLCLAALIALAAAAVRFGPALSVVERRRRSAVEHVDALAAGLERARGWNTAIGLIIEGLRRRLSRGFGRRTESLEELLTWLDNLAVASTGVQARTASERLRALVHEAEGDEAVVDAARTVERLWTELGR